MSADDVPAGSAPTAPGAWATLVRGLRLSPSLRVGLGVTVLLALVATAGRVVVPVALQVVVDRGLQPRSPGSGAGLRVDVGVVAGAAGLAAAAIAATGVANAAMTVRLARTTEDALADLRVRAFRHLHDLSALTLAGERRGSLVARVTADVDTISQFMQWGGVNLLVSVAQVVLATAVMLVYSWQLTLVVLVVFVPLAVVLPRLQRRLSVAYGHVRTRVGVMLSGLSESVVGAEVIRSYGVADRTRERADAAIDAQYRAAMRAVRLGAVAFASGELIAGVALAAVVGTGVLLGVAGDIEPGQLLAFLFLVTLFVAPVQLATEVLDQAQTAIAGWRRVLDLLDTPADVADPGPRAARLPGGPVEVHFDHVDFAYPARDTSGSGDADGSDRSTADVTTVRSAGAPVLVDLDLTVAPGTRVAVVGETGSGKSTFAALLTRLTDPTRGRVLLNGVDVRGIRFADLRSHVLLVPQDGFLFDGTIGENVAMGRPDATPAQITAAFDRLGLSEWLAATPDGLGTRVGERGSALSAGERQLVALVRAAVADPELLVLDEATSSVDPGTEARLAHALDVLAGDRTSVTIAHRLSTAERADEVIVFDRGRVVQRGTHARLVTAEGAYAALHRSWVAATALPH